MYTKERYEIASFLYDSLYSKLKDNCGYYSGVLVVMRIMDVLFAKCFEGCGVNNLSNLSLSLAWDNRTRHFYDVLCKRTYADPDDLMELRLEAGRKWFFLQYYETSTFWELELFDIYHEDFDSVSKRSGVSKALKKSVLEGLPFLEKEPVLLEDSLEQLGLLFTGDDESMGNIFVFKSVLLKYFYIAQNDGVFDTDDEKVELVESYVGDFSRTFSGSCKYRFTSTMVDMGKLEYYYFFISCDWYEASSYGCKNGILDVSYGLAFVGYLIDYLILELDKKYNFVPSHVTKHKIEQL